MGRKHTVGILTAFGLALLLLPGVAEAQFGTCAVGGTGDCSLETLLPGKNLCTDGTDNDGNGLVDADDPHCQSEVLCTDGIDNDSDGLMDGADSDCQCIIQATGLNNPACTANDISISYNSSTTVSDGCINNTDTVTISQLIADVTAAQADRYDIGMWVALTGLSARDGSLCTRETLQPVASDAVIGGTGPYPIPDGSGIPSYVAFGTDADACGDQPSATSSTYTFPFPITVDCSDNWIGSSIGGTPGANGFVDLGQCGSWDNNSNTTCNNPTTALPGTGAKCRCEDVDSSIPGPNFHFTCDTFSANGNNSQIVPGGPPVTFNIDYTNAVANCTPGSPVAPDLSGRTRCGTASFIQVFVDYWPSSPSGTNPATVGTFTYFDGTTDQTIPTCPATGALGGTVGTIDNLGVVCNDTAVHSLVFAPADPNQAYALGVVSPFTGTQTLPFKYALDDNQNITVSLNTSVWWSDSLDGGDNVVTPTEAVDVAFSIEQTCTDCACSTSAQATPVTLSSFRATPEGRFVRFDWTTDTEVGNVGFNLYAKGDNGAAIRLNRQPIRAHGPDSLEPQTYSVTLPVPAGAQRFFVEDLDLRGRARSHGPFVTDRQYGAPAESAKIDWGSVRRQNGLDSTEKARGRSDLRAVADRSSASHKGAKSRRGLRAVTIDLSVDQTGLYRVTYNDLLAAGFDLGRVNSSGIGLTRNGRAIPIYVGGGKRFGRGSYIEFWGEALDSIYSHTNVYRLKTGLKKPARAAESNAVAKGAAPATYLETRSFERNRAYGFWIPGGDPFYDTEMFAWNSPGSWDFSFTVDRVATDDAMLRVELSGGSEFASVQPDHDVRALVNGVEIGRSTFDGITTKTLAATVPAGLLNEGSNTLTLQLPGVPGTLYDVVYMDRFSVTYPRAFEAQAGRLDFAGQSSRYDVTGLPGAGVAAYRRDAAGLTRLNGVSVARDGSSFRATVPGGSGEAHYSVASAASMLKPSAIQVSRPAVDITSGAATYLIISNPLFLSHLNPLIAAREAQGLQVKVVDVEDVYSQFGGGIFGPNAIRDYIAHAYRSMGTRYVLLVGGDSYDYLDDLGYGSLSFIPSIYRTTGDIIRWAPSDAAFADVDGDGAPEVAIGRFPARSPDELDVEIAKTLRYESNGFSQTATFAADTQDAGANQAFSLASDRLIADLPAGWLSSKIYLDRTDLATARSALFAELANGRSLTTYVGHASRTSWGSATPGFQRMLTAADVPLLTNYDKPTVVSQLGCWTNYYTHPNSAGIGTLLLNQPNVGAAAALGSTTLGEDVNSNRFGTLLTPLLATPGMTIGDAILEAKRQFVAQARPNSDLRDILLGWNQLGDPALRVTQ